MNTKTKIWAGLGVAAVLTLVFFGTQPELFKGALGRLRPQAPVTLTASTSFADQETVRGTRRVTLGSWTITTASDTSLNLQNVMVMTESRGRASIEKIEVEVNGARFGTVFDNNLSAGNAAFSTASAVNLGKGTANVVNVYGNISSGYTPLPDKVKMELRVSGLMNGTKPFQSGTVTGQTTYVYDHGTLQFNLDTASPESLSFPPGATNMVIARWNVRASREDVELRKACVSLKGSANMFSGTVKLAQRVAGGTRTLVSFAPVTPSEHCYDLSTYLTVAKNSVEKLVVLVDIAPSAQGSLVVGLGGLEGRGANSASVFGASTYVYAREISVLGPTLSVSTNAAIANDTIVAGSASALIGSFNLQTGSLASIKVTGITLDFLAGGHGVGGNYTNLKLCKRGTACMGVGNQYGQTIAMPEPSPTNGFTIPNLRVAQNGVVSVDILVDVRAGVTGTLTTAINVGDIVASNSSNDVALSNVPSTAVRFQTMNVVPNGSLYAAVTSYFPIGRNFYSNNTAQNVLGFKLAASYEDITIRSMKFMVDGAQQFQVSLNSATDPATGASRRYGSAFVINGEADFQNLTIRVLKNSTANFVLMAQAPVDVTNIDAAPFAFRLTSVRSTGVDSGQDITASGLPVAGQSIQGMYASRLGTLVAFNSPSNNSQLSIGTDVTMGVLDLQAVGVPVYVESIVVQKVGSGEQHIQGAQADTVNTMKILVNGAERAHSQSGARCSVGCWFSSDLVTDQDAGDDDYYVIDFFDPVRVETSASTTFTFQLTTTPTNGSWAVNETLGLRIGGMASAGQSSRLGIDYYWEPIFGSQGPHPTAAHPVAINEYYPIVFGALKN